MIKECREVILAEDDDDDFEFFELAINEMTFPVKLIRASNGEMLFEILGNCLPEILFLDLILPVMDGRQCLQRIRADHKYDAMPIIVYTSSEDKGLIEFTFRQGANFFTMKPTTLEDLKLVLQRIFSIDWKKSLYYPPISDYVLQASSF